MMCLPGCWSSLELSGVVERIRLTSSYQQSPCFVSKVASSDDRAPPAIITVIQLTAFKVVVTDVFNGMMFIHGEVVMFASSSSSSLGGGVYHFVTLLTTTYRLPLYLLPATSCISVWYQNVRVLACIVSESS